MSDKQFRGSGRLKEYEKVKVAERFDFAELVRRQIERCLMSARAPEPIFSYAVQALETLIPRELKDEQYEEDLKGATTLDVVLVFTKKFGYRLGEADNPLVRNELGDIGLSNDPGFTVQRHPGEINWEDPNIMENKNVGTEEDPQWEPVLYDESAPVKRHLGEIDWSDPNIISPKRAEEEDINWFGRFEAAFNMFVRLGIAVRRPNRA